VQGLEGQVTWASHGQLHFYRNLKPSGKGMEWFSILERVGEGIFEKHRSTNPQTARDDCVRTKQSKYYTSVD
jgi:hypothetical protein